MWWPETHTLTPPDGDGMRPGRLAEIGHVRGDEAAGSIAQHDPCQMINKYISSIQVVLSDFRLGACRSCERRRCQCKGPTWPSRGLHFRARPCVTIQSKLTNIDHTFPLWDNHTLLLPKHLLMAPPCAFRCLRRQGARLRPLSFKTKIRHRLADWPTDV
jgi:hypothetical protein